MHLWSCACLKHTHTQTHTQPRNGFEPEIEDPFEFDDDDIPIPEDIAAADGVDDKHTAMDEGPDSAEVPKCG